MKYRARLTGAVALGLAALVMVPTGATAATKKKATTTKKKAAATTAPTTKPAAGAATPAPATKGAKIVYGIGAESNGWLPSTQNWGPEGQQVRVSILENLMAANDKGETVGYLAESATPSSDFKTWTFKIRPNIKFHNGEALNAEAVVLNIKDHLKSALTAATLINLAGCASADELTMVCTMRSRWVTFPSMFLGSLGAIAAPAQLKAADSKKPVGTGPYVFKEWIPNQKFVATRNPSWWRGSAIAEEVEFRVILDDNTRLAQLQSGQLTHAHTSAAVAVNEYLDATKAGKIKSSVTAGPAQVNYDMLNNGAAPFNNKDCRYAASQALDLDTLIKVRAVGFTKANSPFAPGTLGSLKENGTPAFNLDAAKASYEKCKAANGGKDVSFTMATTTSPEAIETRNIKKQMVERAGFTIRTAELPQDQYIGAALTGNFQWVTWRSHGSPDIDTERIWFHSELAAPPGQLAINLGRIRDATIDESFNQIRSNSDPAVRKKAADAISQAFGEEQFNIWNWYSKWVLGYSPKCDGGEAFRLPSGEKVYNFSGGFTPGIGNITCS
jgi:peptide/nickel transport system substrate-binding protein